MLILRDTLGWSARDTASLLEASLDSVTSALQRARATLRDRLPERRTEWARATAPTQEERELLRRYVDAHERADAEALAELLREDARLTMPPIPTWYDGREAIMTAQRQGWDPEFGQLRGLVTAANTQPAAAHYLRRPGENELPAAGPGRAPARGREGGRDHHVRLSGAVSGVRPSPGALTDQFFADLRSTCERTHEGRPR